MSSSTGRAPGSQALASPRPTLVLLAFLGLVCVVSHVGYGCSCPPGDDPDIPSPATGDGDTTITGSVVDAYDVTVPVADAYIYIPTMPSARQAGNDVAGGAPMEATSASDGSFALLDVPAGPQTIVVRPPDNAEAAARDGGGYTETRITIDVPEGASVEIVITLLDGETADQIEDIVVDPPDPTTHPGGTVPFTATINGGQITGITPTWFASNGVGTIDVTGEFTAGTEEGVGTIVAYAGHTYGHAYVSVKNEPPTVGLQIQPESGQAPLPVAALVTATDGDGQIANVVLDWGDGTPPDARTGFPAEPVDHTYERAGSYAATVWATDDSGAVSSIQQLLKVNPPPAPSCELEADPMEGKIDSTAHERLSVLFTGSAEDPRGRIKSWRLDYGDGSSPWMEATAPIGLVHEYASGGNFPAQLTVTDMDGQTGTGTVNIRVVDGVNEPPQASLSVSRNVGNAPLEVSFSGDGADTDGSVVRYVIDFGDGTPNWGSTSAPEDVPHTYGTAGSYSPTLTVTDDDDATGGAVQTITVTEPVLRVVPDALSFVPQDELKTFALLNTGSGTLEWTCTTSHEWIVVEPDSGEQSATINVSLDRTLLPSGTNEGSITVESNGGAREVKVTAEARPVLAVDPEWQGIGTDPSAEIRVFNAGDGVLAWSATCDPWLSLSPSDHTGDATVTVNVDRRELALGDHTGKVVVTSTGGGDKTVFVTVTVGPVTVSPDVLDFGDSGTGLTFDIDAIGGWDCVPSETWIHVAPPSSGTGDGTVTVTIDRPFPEAGTYEGFITVECDGPNQTIDVEAVSLPADVDVDVS